MSPPFPLASPSEQMSLLWNEAAFCKEHSAALAVARLHRVPSSGQGLKVPGELTKAASFVICPASRTAGPLSWTAKGQTVCIVYEEPWRGMETTARPTHAHACTRIHIHAHNCHSPAPPLSRAVTLGETPKTVLDFRVATHSRNVNKKRGGSKSTEEAREEAENNGEGDERERRAGGAARERRRGGEMG